MQSGYDLESITWLPHLGIKKSVESLGSYELEQAWTVGYHTIRTLVGCRNPIEGPTVRLWRGYETALSNYLWHCLQEMYRRDLPDEMEHDLFYALVVDGPRVQSKRVYLDMSRVNATAKTLLNTGLLPQWFGWNPLHKSHRMALQTGDIQMVRWPWERIASAKIRTGVLQG